LRLANRPSPVPRRTIRSSVVLILRYGSYSIAFVFLLLTVPLLARAGASSEFIEDGAIEWFQWAVVTIAAFSFFAAAARYPDYRELLVCLGLLAALAAIREQNNRLAIALPHLGWGAVAGILVTIAAAWLWRRRVEFGRQLVGFAPTAPFALLWCGLLTVVAYAQLIGKRETWQLLVGDAFRRELGRAIQETAEAFGYLLLLVGAIETIIYIGCNPVPEATVDPSHPSDNDGVPALREPLTH
jgi:hypothetical protein